MDNDKELNQKILTFPKNFYWGAATSAHQVEGGNHNDWSQWEKENAERLARDSESMYAHWIPVWNGIKNQALDPKNYISGRACDHYNRFKEDFDIAKSLNQNAHRFSIEWSRIEPEEGKFNKKEIEHYRQVIMALRERRIEPFVTLWHYTHPLWFTARGGWLHPKAGESFLRFTKKVVLEYKDDVKYWLTFNEPETVVREGYLQASRAPQERSLIKAFRVMRNLVETHKNAYSLIHKINSNAMVSFAESLVFFESYNKWPHNLLLKKILQWWRNGQFVPKVISHCDFIGLQYYFHSKIRFNPFVSQWGFQFNENKLGLNDMGWEIYPEGIDYVLKDLKKYNLPVIITENGLADYCDKYRADFIKDHLVWVHKAISEGVDVRGYLYWSFMDNFEWNQGFWPRFGLVEMDYKTLGRKIRPSAKMYAEICKNNALRL